MDLFERGEAVLHQHTVRIPKGWQLIVIFATNIGQELLTHTQRTLDPLALKQCGEKIRENITKQLLGDDRSFASKLFPPRFCLFFAMC